jgi:hypothetical protein
MRKISLIAIILSLGVGCPIPAAAQVSGPPVPISGTFFKGPAIGGVDRLAGSNVLQVRDEQGTGSLNGGVLTGSAEYLINEEIINFAGGIGTLHARISVTTADGSVITLSLSGFTSGVSQTATTVTVSGSWTILSATGLSAPLYGHGQFAGIEDFITGVTNGGFSGLIH